MPNTNTSSAPPSAPAVLGELSTPCLVLERGILQANINTMAQRARALNVELRPHLKTPKSVEIARLLTASGADRFTVSTVLELETLYAAGFKNLFYAVPLASKKVERIAALLHRENTLSFLIDHLDSAKACADAAQAAGVTLRVWVEIDVDHYRTGIDPAAPEFLALIRFLHAHPHMDCIGLMSYGGASYNCASATETAALTERHRSALLATSKSMTDAGLPKPLLSFGSTPAVLHAHTLDGIDEARCGIYIFQDLFQAGIGAAHIEDIALSVLTTVIGKNQGLNRIIVDAGGLALSKDRSTQGRPFDAGFGLVCDAESGALIPDLYVGTVSQELGLITTRSGAALDFAKFPIGRRLRILPNHADMTAAAYETYHVVNGSDRIEAIWTRKNGW